MIYPRNRRRRWLAVISLCGLLVLAGCAEVGLDSEFGGESTPAVPADESTVDAPTPVAPNGTFEVHAINVGQADATLLRTDEETMLIDSGDWRDDGDAVIEYLEAHDVDRIDHLVSTHAHADHIGGHEAVIDHYETERDGIGAIYDSGVPHTTNTYERYLDAVERHDVDLFTVRDGDELPFEGVNATVLNPPEDGGSDLHYNSVTVHLQFGNASFLFTGDAERDAESRLLDEHGSGLQADVYHAGHHGSDTSSGPEFLDAVDPAVTIISADYDSQYGHPHDEPLERFAERDVRAAWTGVHGTVVFVSDGEEISVRTQHDATFDPLELRDESVATAPPAEAVDERFVVETTPPARLVAPTASTVAVEASG